MAYKITDIEGIGSVLQEKFEGVGIKTVAQLLEKGATKKGRKELAAAMEIDVKKLLVFVNNADLFRVKGVSSQYADLLKASGVDTVKELRNRKPENLQAKMKEVNTEQKLVRQIPSVNQVIGYVNAAKELDPVVTY